MRDRAAVNTCALKTVCSLSRHARWGLHLPFPWLSQSEMQHQLLPDLSLHGMLFSTQAWRPGRCGPRYLVEECQAITQIGCGLCGSVWSWGAAPRKHLLGKQWGLCRTIKGETLRFKLAQLLTNSGWCYDGDGEVRQGYLYSRRRWALVFTAFQHKNTVHKS